MGSETVTNPFLWAFISALFFGAAVSRVTVLPSRTRYPERTREWKWVWVAFYFSFSILFALAGFFVSGPRSVSSPGLSQFFFIAAGICFLIFRFKRLIGFPVIVLASFLVVSILLFVQSFSSFTVEERIAVIRVISVGKEEMSLEVQATGGDSLIVTMKGVAFAPVVEIVSFDDVYIFLGARSYYRFLGMMSFMTDRSTGSSVYRQAQQMVALPGPHGITGKVYGFFERYESKLPGIRAVQTDIVMKKPKQFAIYDLLMKADGGLFLSER